MSHHLIITPKTKVLQLLEEYPQLEEVLIDFVPAFEQLRNPVLRRTVARVATLQQAASIAGLKVEDLVNRLRSEVGQDLLSGAGEAEYKTDKPEWFSEDIIAGGLDAREMLDAGEHPVGQVIADLNGMKAGAIYKLTAPFLPAPLIDKASSLGALHWVRKENDGHFIIYFYKE